MKKEDNIYEKEIISSFTCYSNDSNNVCWLWYTGTKDSKKDDSSASSGKKRITYTLREDLPSMDPQNSNSISCATAEICTYAMLTRNVEGEIKPDAAESWDISDDGLTYTFHLRDGLKWSDGEDVKAGDYVYGIQRLMDPEMASDYAFIGYILKTVQK